MDFKHPLFIPKVITPNEDGFIDSFEIIPIELYPDNYLVINNRWGKKGYEKKNYQGGWNPGNQDTGIYYYELSVKRINQVFRGWVDILH